MSRGAVVLTSHDTLGDTGRATGWYLPEAAHPWKVFTEAGYELTFTSPEGGRPAMDGVDADDPLQQAFLDMYGTEGPDTLKAATVDPSRYDAIFYVGGHGAMWDFPDDTHLSSAAADIYGRGGVVAAVCHGPAGLVNIRLGDGSHLVDGRRVAAFTDAEEAAVGLTEVVPFLLETRLTQRGAIHQAAANFQPQVIADGRLITGQNPASAAGVAEAIVAQISSRVGS